MNQLAKGKGKAKTVYRYVKAKAKRRGGKSLSKAFDPIYALLATFGPEAYTYFANGGGLNGAAKALSLKTGFDFSTGQMVPANMLLGWGPVTLYKAGKKLPAIANKILSRI